VGVIALSGLPLVAVLLSAAALGAALRFGRALDALPSLAWSFLAALPFLYLSQYFPPDAALKQAIGIAAVGIALGVGDLVAVWILGSSFGMRGGSQPVGDRVATGGAGFAHRRFVPVLVLYVIALPAIHLGVAGEAPLAVLLSGETGAMALVIEREQFSKLLDVPGFLKIMFHWVIVIAGPLLVILLYSLKQYGRAIAALGWCALYAVLSLAKLPLLIFAAVCSIGVVAVHGPRVGRVAVIACLAFLTIWISAGVYRGSAIMEWYERLPEEVLATEDMQRLRGAEIGVTPGDLHRLEAASRPVTFGSTLDSLLYRSVLTPMEVANRWYVYFPEVTGDWRSIWDLLPLPRAQAWRHAANRIAQWAYVDRFPGGYLPSARAYAGVDADAYAFGGMLACGIAAVLLAAIRLCFAVFNRNNMVANALYACALALMATLPFQASLQAMLVPQGLAVLISVHLTWYWLGARRRPGQNRSGHAHAEANGRAAPGNSADGQAAGGGP
jgi:hypothetical protein